ncbi:hypothetical protein F5B20DRAFT_556256 [Whalleya microplaca]|nr:hypothetical protein F5B20DRAFT_556256 [Whalleya microplaca]
MLSTRFAVPIGKNAIRRQRFTSNNLPNRPNANSHHSTGSTTLRFSTSSRLATKKSDKKSSTPEDIPNTESFFKGLGMTRNTKIIVIVILSIYGTIESIFWIRVFLRWMRKDKNDESGSEA